MYVLVLFAEEGSHEVVWSSWIEGSVEENSLREVAYPSKSEARNIRTLLKKKVDPKSTWCSHEARILFFDDSLHVVQQKSTKYQKFGDLESTDTECGRRKWAPDRYLEHLARNPKTVEESDHDATSELPPTPTPRPLPSLPNRPSISDDLTSSRLQSPRGPPSLIKSPMITAQSSNPPVIPVSEHPASNPNNDFVGSTKIDEAVCRKGYTPGTEGATYFLVSQLFRRVVSLEAELKELRLQLASRSSTSATPRRSGFRAPVIQEQCELEAFSMKLEDSGFRSDLVNFLALEGGSKAITAVCAIVHRLMSRKLQSTMNISGTCGKRKFGDDLINLVHDALTTLSLFIDLKLSDVRGLVRTALKMSNDRKRDRSRSSVDEPTPKRKKRWLLDSDSDSDCSGLLTE